MKAPTPSTLRITHSIEPIMSLTQKQKDEAIQGAALSDLNVANVANPDPARVADWARNYGYVIERQEDPNYPGDPHRGEDVEVLRIVDPSTGKARMTPNLQGVMEPMPHARLISEMLYKEQLAVNARIAAGSRRH